MPGDFETKPFLKPILRGGRFDSALPSVPVEFLAEFAAYEKLVLEVACALYREAKGRRRVPEGFVDAFQLRLSAIEEGSTIPVLVRSLALAASLSRWPPALEGAGDVFEQARDRVTACVESVVETGKIPANFPQSALRFFENFGKRLEPGESIELRAPGAQIGPRYTKETQQAISERLRNSKPVVLFGKISGLDGNSRRFNIDVSEPHERNYKRLPYHPEMHIALASCLAQFKANPERSQARIVATAAYDDHGRIVEIVSVAQVQPLDGAITPVSEQLGQLRTLSPGWLDGHGVPPSAESIEWTAQILGQLPSDGSIPRPYLYPTPEGSIQAEWDIGPWSVTAEVDVASRCLSVSALNTQTQAGLDKDFTENHPHELANFLLFLKPDQRAN